MNFVINGINYHVDIRGNGFPLILLHGFTGSSSTWAAFENKWSMHSQMISLDIIGHGESDSPEEISCYEIEHQAEVIYSLMKKMNIGKADILGYSMGGRLALTFAVKYPHMVRSLILESTSPGLKTALERDERQARDFRLCELISEKGLAFFVDYWEDIPLFSSQKRLSEQKWLAIRNQRLRNNPLGLINSLKGMGTGAQPSWWDELIKIEFPVLLITGSLDQKFCQLANEMESDFRYAKWKVVEACGHAIHVENPEIFATFVSDFLAEIAFSKENGEK